MASTPQTVRGRRRPIIIHPDGDLTINYLDTKGLPLRQIICRRRPHMVAHDWNIGARRINRCSAVPDRQIPESALRGFVSGLAEEAATSCSPLRGTLALQKFAPSGCRPAQRPSILLRTSATGRAATRMGQARYLAAFVTTTCSSS